MGPVRVFYDSQFHRGWDRDLIRVLRKALSPYCVPYPRLQDETNLRLEAENNLAAYRQVREMGGMGSWGGGVCVGGRAWGWG